MSVTTFISCLAAGVVLLRTVCLAANMSASAWQGHPFRFATMAAANSMLAAGALGVVLGWYHGTSMLLLGAAVKMVSDRRRGDA